MVGEFKDDCLQKITGDFNIGAESGASYGIGPVGLNDGAFYKGDDYCSKYQVTQIQASGGAVVYFDSSRVTRYNNNVTHGKQKGVKYIIKVL